MTLIEISVEYRAQAAVIQQRLRELQAQLPELSAQYVDEDEQAFLEGEAAQYGPQGRAWRKRFWRRE